MIETVDLTKKFGTLTAVDGVTFRVEEGEVFGFLGPNGAGKTTTVRMLCCLISKTSGEARVGGYDVGDEADSLKIRKLIGLVPDNVGLYDSLSAYDNLDFYGKLYDCPEAQRKENIQRVLTMLGLWEKRDVLAGTFSKGMKQKLAIARALIHDPQILFMDEPTANLDPESARAVREFILELKKEKKTDLPQHPQPRRGPEDMRQDRDTEHQAHGGGHAARSSNGQSAEGRRSSSWRKRATRLWPL